MRISAKAIAISGVGIMLIVGVTLAINSYDLARLSLRRGAEQPARLLFLLAAKLGDGRAQNNVASMYAEGRGGERSDKLAVYWYQRAADAGITQAMFNLANFYEEGRGVARSTPKAAEFFRKAAEKGDVQASFNLGVLYASQRTDFSQDYAAATTWYLKAANGGFASAQYNLGSLYVKGLNGPKDIERAREWYEKAAAQGHAKAILDLGAIHAFGLSRISNPELGMNLLQRAVKTPETADQAIEHIEKFCVIVRLTGLAHTACANA